MNEKKIIIIIIINRIKEILMITLHSMVEAANRTAKTKNVDFIFVVVVVAVVLKLLMCMLN